MTLIATLDILDVQEILSAFFFGDQIGRRVIMLSQLPDSANIGFLSSLRLPLELKTLDHSLSEFGPSYTSGLICLVANRSVVDLTFRSRMIELFSGESDSARRA